MAAHNSAWLTGRPKSPETRAKISATLKTRGWKPSAEHQLKLDASHTKHGHNSRKGASPTYRSWHEMNSRCHGSPKAPNFAKYGARGVTVCDRWRREDGFQNFLADMGERPPGTSIDRIDNDKNYESGNCRWATVAEQHANQRYRNQYSKD